MKQIFKSIFVHYLLMLARIVLLVKRPIIIAVVGSVGKTSTKDACAVALSTLTRSFRASQKSMNGEIGVPLTILDLNPGHSPLTWTWVCLRALPQTLYQIIQSYPTYLVLEVGSDAPGDIALLGSFLRPHHVVLTALPDIPSHAANFLNAQAVRDEDWSIVNYIRRGGTLIANGDDDHTRKYVAQYKLPSLTYGKQGAVSFSSTRVMYRDERPVGMSTQVAFEDKHEELIIHGVLGEPTVYASLAALALVIVLSNDFEGHRFFERTVRALSDTSVARPAGRMRILEGAHASILIDDTYNASPSAVMAALRILHMLTVRGRKVAVLGDMRELGSYAEGAHRAVGHKAAEVADILFVLGPLSETTALAAQEAGLDARCIYRYQAGEATRLGQDLRSLIADGDVVLLKGSQNTIRLEKAVAELLAYPERDKELLVRQGAAWE